MIVGFSRAGAEGAKNGVDQQGQQGAEHVVEEVFLGVGFGVGAVEFEHAFFRAEDEGAGVFDQFVNPAEAENHDDGADPKLPTNQGKAVAEGARDDESPGDAEVEVDVGVEIEAEILFLVAAEGAEVMQDGEGSDAGVWILER